LGGNFLRDSYTKVTVDIRSISTRASFPREHQRTINGIKKQLTLKFSMIGFGKLSPVLLFGKTHNTQPAAKISTQVLA